MMPQKTNVINLPKRPPSKVKLTLQEELIQVEQSIQDYLERVEFYFEDPDVAKLKALQDKRTKLKLLTAKKSSEDKVINELRKEVSDLQKRVNHTESLLDGVKSKLDRERQLRIKLHTRLQIYRREIYRSMYDAFNEKPDSLKWVSNAIAKEPEWGLLRSYKDITSN